MPTLRTELTEIVTGLGMLGMECLDEALEARPPRMHNVTAEHLGRLVRARRAGEHRRLFRDAWDNGRAFAASADGLRRRVPQRVEWKGNHRSPGYEQVPADLRVDYVYLISCKYRSKVLYNASPAHVFDRLLATRRGEGTDWYLEAAPSEYQEFYRACRDYLGAGSIPEAVQDLDREHRSILKETFKRRWPPEIADAYRPFCTAVSEVSARRWQEALGTNQAVHEEMLWRLLRLQPAPYFILGVASPGHPVRFRVDTPWDFRQRYTLRTFEVRPDTEAGQPAVGWRARLTDVRSATPAHVEGHVEVRWSHGRFSGAPEAKVYLDTPQGETPGYSGLRCSGREPPSQLSLL
ncbi:MAG: hypothetical protein OXS29_16915 [bacterium]|nr:hypothetical protein [bacterium]MDE0437626.1 hypothetical protein [bacterium]